LGAPTFGRKGTPACKGLDGLLFEDDPVVMSVLLVDEDIDVTRRESFEEIQLAVDEYPEAVVVSDFSSEISSVKVGEPERAGIQALGMTASVILSARVASASG
jgi:hypothetical protein